MKEIYIDEFENLKKVYIIEDEEIIEKHTENTENPMNEGNIYIGKIQNVLPGMQAAFVKIGSAKNAFIHLKDLIPKEDLTQKSNIHSKVDIRKVVRPGDTVFVQVMRDENYKKGAKVTTHISFGGKFFAYMPETPFITVSSKVKDEKTRAELKKFFKENLPENVGGIVRTNAAIAEKDDIIKEINLLNNRWLKIKNEKIEKVPKKIYDAGGIVRKCIIDNFNAYRILVKNQKLFEEVDEILKTENMTNELLLDSNYLKKYNFENQIMKSENRKIWLKCGGFITIDKTEALTAIDVNTGKFIGKDDFEKTIFEVNKEATIEIVKQLRLRDIGGIVIIDYIDMHVEENKEQILKLMKEETEKDSSKIQIEGFTKLNLLELTRKHIYTM